MPRNFTEEEVGMCKNVDMFGVRRFLDGLNSLWMADVLQGFFDVRSKKP